ncbi:MAG: immune inhibitor A domain-containing protein, partial [Candidatus Nanopelagicales bacterium]
MGTPSSAAAPGVDDVGPSVTPSNAEVADHDLPNPLEDKRRELREQAITGVINGELIPQTINGSTVVKVGEAEAAAAGAAAEGELEGRAAKENASGKVDQYVELSNERTDQVFTLLVEFGNERHPDYPDKDLNEAVAGPQTFDGPLHNQIPEPDRKVDNSTAWQPDFSREYFDGLYFGTDQESL